MKKLWILSSVILLFLSGCSLPRWTPEQEYIQKTPFYITTKTFQEITQQASLKKYGKILGANDIVVTAQVMGRVKNINAKIGDTVSKDQKIITLADSNGNYSFNVQRTKTAREQAKIAYEQTQLSLGKAVTDTELALQQAEKQANEATLDAPDSTASLQVEQLKQQVTKAEHDYQTKLEADQTTLQNFIDTTKNIVKDTQLLYEDIKIGTDKIMGTSDLYKAENDAFERILGVRNTSTKFLAETQVRLLRQKQQQIDALWDNITQENLQETLSQIKTLLESFVPALDAVDTMLEYTITWNGLSQTQLSTFIASIDGLQAKLQGQLNMTTQQINSIEQFLATYKQQEESLRQWVELAKQQARIAQENLETANFSTDIQKETVSKSYETAKKNKDTTEQAMLKSIEQARIAYAQASNELAKLTVKSPISGTIGDILVDIGQEVAPWTPLFNIMSDHKLQIEVALGADERDQVQDGQEVQITTETQTFSWTLSSLSRTADRNLTYKALINVDQTVTLLGDVVEVNIPLQNAKLLMPINIITIIDSTTWLLPLFDQNTRTIQEKTVQLGKVWGNQIEILSDIDPHTQIIASDISNYDENKYELQIKQ